MKTNLILSAAVVFGLSFSNVAWAKHGDPSTPSKHFKGQFDLVATADAPAGAKGKAQVEADDEDGAVTSKLVVQTQGLDPGTYTVNIIRTSDGVTVAAGDITVEDTGNSQRKSSTQLELPAEVGATDIAQVIVSDGGTDLLVGNLGDGGGKSKATMDATVPITAGEAAPDATGFATMRSTIKKGELKTRFTLVANGVPASSTFTVVVDGVEAGTVNSNKKGRVMVKKLPSDITTFSTVQLLDADSAEVVRVDF